MNIITQYNLADYEKVDLPKIEKSNFTYSFSFLPKEERDAMNSLYAFCAYIDDIVDGTPNANQSTISKKLKRLDWWDEEIDKLYFGNLRSSIILPFASILKRFDIPAQYFHTLIAGVRRDLIQNRYNTFEELKEYCYSVASVVGLISIEIFGYKYEETKNYAINLGYALQLTNILRDVKQDFERGYIYLPQEDLTRFKYSDTDLAKNIYNQNFVELMRFETGRAREYYFKARTSLRPDERSTTVAAEIMDAIYYRLLEKIELNEYNVFDKRIRVASIHKVLITLKHWLSIKMFVQRIKK